jgi:hypothetical protein
MIPAEICRAALCEAGRPDLARNIGTNRAGDPMRAWTAYYGADANLVARAFALAYGARLEPATDVVLVALLRQEICSVHHGPPDLLHDEIWHFVPRHWSPRLNRWSDTFTPDDWQVPA